MVLWHTDLYLELRVKLSIFSKASWLCLLFLWTPCSCPLSIFSFRSPFTYWFVRVILLRKLILGHACVLRQCPTLQPQECSPPDSCVHGISQAILQWAAASSSRRSDPGIEPASPSSCTALRPPGSPRCMLHWLCLLFYELLAQALCPFYSLVIFCLLICMLLC